MKKKEEEEEERECLGRLLQNRLPNFPQLAPNGRGQSRAQGMKGRRQAADALMPLEFSRHSFSEVNDQCAVMCTSLNRCMKTVCMFVIWKIGEFDQSERLEQ